MKKSLRLKKVALVIAVLMVLTAFSLSGCDSQAKDEKTGSDDVSSSEKTLNDEVLLTTEQVEQLLKDNGIDLTRDNNFDVSKFTYVVSRSDTDKPEFKPTAYIYKINGGTEDAMILIYELDEYISFNGVYVSLSDAKANLLIKDDAVCGKNIIVWPLYYVDELENQADSVESVIDIKNKIFDILYNNAFNGKDLTYEGSKDGWSVIADVRQFKNIYSEGTSRDSVSEYAFGEVFIKRDGAQSAEDVLAQMSSFTWDGDIEFPKEAIAPLTESEEHPGYFRISPISGNSDAFEYGEATYTAGINGDEVVIELETQ